jgi:hypothetical protein
MTVSTTSRGRDGTNLTRENNYPPDAAPSEPLLIVDDVDTFVDADPPHR